MRLSIKAFVGVVQSDAWFRGDVVSLVDGLERISDEIYTRVMQRVELVNGCYLSAMLRVLGCKSSVGEELSIAVGCCCFALASREKGAYCA